MNDNASVEIEAMIRLAKSGDTCVRGELLERYRAYLKLLAERAIGHRLERRADGSDVVQQAFLEACRDFDRFRGSTEAELSGWLHRILQRNLANLIRDQHAGRRDLSREQSLDAMAGTATFVWHEPASTATSPSQKAIAGERALRLAEALEHLPDDQRTAVRLRHLEGHSLNEIASRLERSPAAAAGLIKRGLRTLRETFRHE